MGVPGRRQALVSFIGAFRFSELRMPLQSEVLKTLSSAFSAAIAEKLGLEYFECPVRLLRANDVQADWPGDKINQ